MKLRLVLIMITALTTAPLALAEAEEVEAETGRGVWGHALWYLPNRVLDVFDIARARVRLGPGNGIDLRATQLADFYIGSYTSVYAGLPGPRGRRIPRLPAGLESRTGVEVSAADATLEGMMGPDYGLAEFGVGLHLFFLGLDVGVDPLEIVDLLAGFVLIDVRSDDF